MFIFYLNYFIAFIKIFYLPLFCLSITMMIDYFIVEVLNMELTEVTKFRRAVLTGIAKFTWSENLPEHVYDIFIIRLPKIRRVSVAACIKNVPF